MAHTGEARLSMAIVKHKQLDDGSVLVYGRPTDETVDSDGQIADKGWFTKALPEWFRWGNVREMHQLSAVGKATELTFDQEGDPWVTARIVDPVAVRKVLDGVYQGFSISIQNVKTKFDRNAPNGRIVGGDVTELSVVDRPSVPTSELALAKAIGNNKWQDKQTGAILKRDMGDLQSDVAGRETRKDARIEDGDIAADIVDLRDDKAIVRVGDELWEAPLIHDDNGEVHVGTPHRIEEEEGAEKNVGTVDKAVWSTQYQDGLPDSAFAYVEPGGKKKDGRTHPLSLRHLPYKDKDGKVDAAHVRDALSRLPQTHISDEAKDEARKKLERAAKEVGVDVSDDDKKRKTEEADDREGEIIYCPECGHEVEFIPDQEGLEELDDKSGGREKGKCEKGHKLTRFVSKEEMEKRKAELSEDEDGVQKGDKSEEEAVTKQIEELQKELDRLKELQAKDADDDGDDDKRHKSEDNEGKADDRAADGEYKAEDEDKSEERNADGEFKASDEDKSDEDKSEDEDEEEKAIEEAEKALKALRARRCTMKANKSHGRLGKALRRAARLHKAAFGNDGGPADVADPTEAKELREEFRMAVKEVRELTRAFVEGDDDLGYERAERQDTAPDSMGVPRGGNAKEWDFRKEALDEHVNKAVGQSAGSIAKAVASEIEKALKPLNERLAQVEHTAIPGPTQLTVAERDGWNSNKNAGDPLDEQAKRTQRIRDLRNRQESMGGSDLGYMLAESIRQARGVQ